MFWQSKVECDGCNAKIPKKGALFHRGSFFCNLEHLQGWEIRNPPKMASGDPVELKAKLVHAVDGALYELKRINPNAEVDQVLLRFVPVFGATASANAERDHQENLMRFTEWVHECTPIVRALGYPEIEVLQKFGFGASMAHVVEALERVRYHAAQQ